MQSFESAISWNRTSWRQTLKVHGGDHWGPAGNVENVFEGALVGNGQFVRFDLRAKHTADLDVFGVAVVVTLD